MQTLLLVFILAVGTNADLQEDYELAVLETQRSLIDDMLKQALNSLISSLPEKIQVSNYSLDLPADGPLTGSGIIEDLEIVGHKQLAFTSLSVDIFSLSLKFVLALPSLNVSAKYDIDVTAAELLPLYSDGSADIHLNDLEISASGAVDLFKMSVKNIVAAFTLGESSSFDLHGLFNNEAFSVLISTLLNNNVAKFINDNKDIISTIISPIIEQIINQAL